MSNAVEDLRQALALMERALSLLDEVNEAFDVAAHLDLAIERLRQHVDAQAA
jgi:hypothetical protein